MIRYLLCLVFVTVAASSAGYAQVAGFAGHRGTAEQQRACRSDALRLCHGIHDDDAVFQCLRAHIASLHSTCRVVVENAR